METRKTESSTSENTLKTYFNQIKGTPLLTFEEEIELSKRIQSGDAYARRKLIEANLKLVVKIAKAFKNTDVTLIDLIQEGNLGLMKAADKFDYRKNVRFSTYASWWIKQSIVRALSNKRRAIRLPHRKEEKLRKINKAMSTLSQKYMRKPELTEIAKEVGMQEKEVLTILNITDPIISLDSENNSESGTLLEIFEDYSYDPNKDLMSKSLQEETMKSLMLLKEKERKIILYRFSFHGGKKYTLKKIGKKMGISPETVRQIELRALTKLKENAGDLRDFWYN
jgi:RNA polymerase primary sigma factor